MKFFAAPAANPGEEYDQPSGTVEDTAFTIRYTHDAEDWWWDASVDDLGDEFRADSGFVPQVGVRSASALLFRHWWGDTDDWYSKISVGGDWRYEEDQGGGLLSRLGEVGFKYQGGLRSSFSVDFAHADEG